MRRLPDELTIIRSVLINCSMFLTGWFGWSWGSSGGEVLGVVTALIFMMVTRGVGRFFILSARYHRQGAHASAVLWLALGSFCGVVNILTDYGVSAAMRDQSIVQSSNQNALAKDARGEVKRLEKRIAEIRATTQWKTTWLSPEAYDAKILALKNETESGRNIFQRSKECTNTTVASSQRVCQAIAQATADKANAQNRLAMKAELVQLERELVEAKAQAADNQTVSNPAVAQIKSIVAWVGLSREASDNKVFWGNQGIMLITCVLMTFAIIGLSIEQGLREGRHLEGDLAPVDHHPAPPRQLTTQAAPEPAERDAWRTHYESRTTVVERQDDSLRALQDQLAGLGQQLSGKAQKWQAAGGQ